MRLKSRLHQEIQFLYLKNEANNTWHLLISKNLGNERSSCSSKILQIQEEITCNPL